MDAPTRNWGYAAATVDLVADRPNGAWLQGILDDIRGGQPGCEQAILIAEKLRLSAGDSLPVGWATKIDDALLGFRYHYDDPGTDAVNRWSEHRQVMFAVAEYLAGQLYPQRQFGIDQRSGLEKQGRAATRLRRWLDDRFTYGFSEWLSPSPYAATVSALCLLIDYTADEDLSTRASMVLDLVLLDLALHRYGQRFVASGGRVSRDQKMTIDKPDALTPILDIAFGHPPRFVPDQLSSVFLDRVRYQVPDVLVEIAHASGIHSIRTCHGADIADLVERAEKERTGRRDQSYRDGLVARLWGVEAFTTTESIKPTMSAIRKHGVPHPQLETQVAPWTKLVFGSTARAAIAARNPVTQGTALQHANVQTYRTPDYLLTSTQHYRPGGFGHQESIWLACLPGDISVFSTHPGTAAPPAQGRPTNPSEWVGNGILPDVAQEGSVALVLHDLKARAGLAEGPRQLLSHLHFPFPKFDETWLSDTVVAGRRGDAYIAVASIRPLELVSSDELVQRGRVTGWAVLLTDRSEYAHLEDFTEALQTFELSYHRGTLSWEVSHTSESSESRSRHSYRLTFGQRFSVDEKLISDRYARYDCDWVTMPRGASVVEVKGHTKTLMLDWQAGSRNEVVALW